MNKKTVLLRLVLPAAASVIGVVWGRHHRYELAWFFLVFSIGVTLYVAWIAYKNWPTPVQWQQKRSDACQQVSMLLLLMLCGICMTYVSSKLVLPEGA